MAALKQRYLVINTALAGYENPMPAGMVVTAGIVVTMKMVDENNQVLENERDVVNKYPDLSAADTFKPGAIVEAAWSGASTAQIASS